MFNCDSVTLLPENRPDAQPALQQTYKSGSVSTLEGGTISVENDLTDHKYETLKDQTKCEEN